MPKVSITMTAYNAEDYIADAMQSVLEQTFTDFECIIVDDGSTDNTWQILSNYNDPRLVRVRREHDYIASLNCAQQLARGIYIAHMDADDIMHPQRLEIQVAKMEECPEIDICSTWMKGFNGEGYTKLFTLGCGKLNNPHLALLKQNILYHPTTMLRRAFWLKHQLSYQQNYAYAEDYKLWCESAAKGAKFYIIPMALHYYRTNEQQVSRTHNTTQCTIAEKVRKDIMQHSITHSPYATAMQTLFEALTKLETLKLLTHHECVEIWHRMATRAEHS